LLMHVIHVCVAIARVVVRFRKRKVSYQTSLIMFFS
jgi:hypothetical protein